MPLKRKSSVGLVEKQVDGEPCDLTGRAEDQDVLAHNVHSRRRFQSGSLVQYLDRIQGSRIKVQGGMAGMASAKY